MSLCSLMRLVSISPWRAENGRRIAGGLLCQPTDLGLASRPREKIARRVDAMLTLFPFEVPLYTAAGLAADVSAIHSSTVCRHCRRQSRLPRCAALTVGAQRGVTPGSRRQEIQRLLPPMLKAFQLITERLPHTQGVLPVAPTLQRAEMHSYLHAAPSALTVLQGAQYRGTLRGDVCHGEFWNGDA